MFWLNASFDHGTQSNKTGRREKDLRMSALELRQLRRTASP